MIERSNPDVGYIAPSFYESINVSQTVKVNGMIHYSGILAAGPDGSCMAPGDAEQQIQWVLEVLKRLLQKEGLSFRNLVSTTLFTTDMELMLQHMPIFTEAYAGAPPASTWIEVKQLASPDFLLELVAIAAE